MQRDGPLGAFGPVVREQFVGCHENTAVLLGLDLRTREWGGEWGGRQDVVFLLSRRGGFPHAVIYEWS